MATVTCAISGLRFKTDFLSTSIIDHTDGYFHPVFALSHKKLHSLYPAHCTGKLNATDSYLLFLALLNSTGQIEWKHPATVSPADSSTTALIENCIAQLVTVINKTAVIVHPRFKQPSFVLSRDNSRLHQIPNWIKAWEDNIESFHTYRANKQEREDLQEVENTLSKLILSGESPDRYPHIIADWACAAAGFPTHKRESYKRTIRCCFNREKMFNTPLADIKEVKDFCENNIVAGSIHFHTLSTTLRKGITNHLDYLGGTSMELGYTLLSSTGDSDSVRSAEQNEQLLSAIAETAPLSAPVESAYSSKLEFLKASLAYRLAVKKRALAPDSSNPASTSTDPISEL